MRIILLVPIFLVLTGGSTAAEDIPAGEEVFAKCRVCHSVGVDAENKVGPQLNGIVGRPWGSSEGYKYSEGREGTLLDIHADEPRVWDVETLRAYVRAPKEVIPKGKMPFGGIKDEEDLTDLICYLAQFDASGEEVDPESVLNAN